MNWEQLVIPGMEWIVPEELCGQILGHPAHLFRRLGQDLACPGIGLLAGPIPRGLLKS